MNKIQSQWIKIILLWTELMRREHKTRQVYFDSTIQTQGSPKGFIEGQWKDREPLMMQKDKIIA